MKYAQSLVRRVCNFAGQVTCIDDLQDEAIETGLVAAVEVHDTAVIFDWLMRNLAIKEFPTPWPTGTSTGTAT